MRKVKLAPQSPRTGRKIAVISHAHPAISKGGAEISAYTLFMGLKSLGIPCCFVAACPNAKMSAMPSLPGDEFVISYDPQLYSHRFHNGPPGVALELAGLLKREGVAVASFHHYLGFGLSAIDAVADAGIQCFLTLHEFLALCHNHGQMITNPHRSLCHRSLPSACANCFPEIGYHKFQLRKYEFMEHFSRCAGFVSPSGFLKQRYMDWGLSADRIAVIENGLPRTGELREPLVRSRDSWRFGYFGQINPFKGVDLLLRAVRSIAQEPGADTRGIKIRIHGNLVGDVSAIEAELNASIAEGLVEYYGPYQNAQVKHLMADCDYVVVPSKWWENSPVVIQEAYGAGRPIIAANIGGMAEKIEHLKTGIHFNFNDAHSLASAMKLAADQETYDSLVSHIVKPIDDAEMALLYLGFFEGRSQG